MIKNIGNNKYKDKLIRSCSVEVRSMSEYPGYGVFALDLIPIDTIIEECVVPFDRLSYHNHALIHYKFEGDESGDAVIPLGIAAILNSSKDNPNCIIEQDTNYERIVRIRTIKQVLLNEQLTHNYYNK
tara:strand:+ start:4558 stop:4941 length:384 start_codon:yes stop_codon:yes gene_type:complete